ncbi:MAG TPA: hypothetical protein VGI28_01895 [Stellaceae bacterium]|jgi:hypothetical protein
MPEVTLTLASKAEDLPQFERALLDMAGARPAERVTLTSTYYDTTAGRLKRDGLALQVRKRDGQSSPMVIMADLKGEPPLGRQECEDVIDGKRQDLRALNGSAHLPEVFSDPELRARFTTVVQRAVFLLEPDASTQIAGMVDAGEIQTASWAPWYVVQSDNKRRARLNVLTHILSKIPREELPRAKVELPKRQHRGDYKDPDYPFRLVPEVF